MRIFLLCLTILVCASGLASEYDSRIVRAIIHELNYRASEMLPNPGEKGFVVFLTDHSHQGFVTLLGPDAAHDQSASYSVENGIVSYTHDQTGKTGSFDLATYAADPGAHDDIQPEALSGVQCIRFIRDCRSIALETCKSPKGLSVSANCATESCSFSCGNSDGSH